MINTRTLVENGLFSSASKGEFARLLEHQTKDLRSLQQLLKQLDDGRRARWMREPSAGHAGMSAVHQAIESRCSLELVEALVAAGADLNQASPIRQSTALHMAVELDRPPLLEYLVLGCNGVDLNAANARGESALHVCFSGGRCNLDALRFLLNQKGVFVNAQDADANSALHCAVAQRNADAVQLLMEHGANPKLKNGQRKTPMYMAQKEANDRRINEILFLKSNKERFAFNIEQPLPTFKPARFQTQNPPKTMGHTPNTERTRVPADQQAVQNSPPHNKPKTAGKLSVVNISPYPGRAQTKENGRGAPMVPDNVSEPMHQEPKRNEFGSHVSKGSPNLHRRQAPQHQTARDIEDGENSEMEEEEERGGLEREDSSIDDTYQMDAEPRGYCIIFNVESYFDGSFEERGGSDEDMTRLERLFKALHFSVKLFKNLSAREILKTTTAIAYDQDHTDYDAFVCCILAHGRDGGRLVGSDGDSFSMSEMTSPFSARRCPSLAGKPKLFLVQACRGEELQLGEYAADSYLTDALPCEPHVADRQAPTRGPTVQLTRHHRHVVPDMADFFIGYISSSRISFVVRS